MIWEAGPYTNVEMVEPGGLLVWIIKYKVLYTDIKKGLNDLNFGVPIERRTVAPAPVESQYRCYALVNLRQNYLQLVHEPLQRF